MGRTCLVCGQLWQRLRCVVHLISEDIPEFNDKRLRSGIQRRWIPHQIGQGDYRVIGEATGDDALPIGHVWVDVEREAVTGHSMHIHFDSDGGQLAGLATGFGWAAGAARSDIRLNPHPGQSLDLSSHEPESSQGLDQNSLKLTEVAHVVGLGEMSLGIHSPKRKEWVADELAWSMIGDITAPIHPMDRDASGIKLTLAPKQVFSMARLSEGVCVRVLKEQKGGRPPALGDFSGHHVLDVPCLIVVNFAQEGILARDWRRGGGRIGSGHASPHGAGGLQIEGGADRQAWGTLIAGALREPMPERLKKHLMIRHCSIHAWAYDLHTLEQSRISDMQVE